MIAPRRRWPGLLRWTLAALTAALSHGGLAWAVVNWRPASTEAAAGAPEPAILIELSAVSVAPEAPAETLPPAPERIEPEQTPPEPVEDMPDEPEPLPEPVVKPMQAEIPEPEIKLPELPSVPDAAAVLPPLPERPKEIVKPVERKPPPPPRVVERRPVDKPKPRQAAGPPPAPPRSTAPVAPTQGAEQTPSVSPASWRGSLIAHLNRYKRFPGGAQPGTVQVAFSIDRAGRVLSARLTGSSGDPALDEEAVAMIRRASPVPAPPSGLGGGTIALAVPVRFSR